MLAPFTAGWQSTDLHPLVIEKSEVNFNIIYLLISLMLNKNIPIHNANISVLFLFLKAACLVKLRPYNFAVVSGFVCV